MWSSSSPYISEVVMFVQQSVCELPVSMSRTGWMFQVIDLFSKSLRFVVRTQKMFPGS